MKCYQTPRSVSRWPGSRLKCARERGPGYVYIIYGGFRVHGRPSLRLGIVAVLSALGPSGHPAQDGHVRPRSRDPMSAEANAYVLFF